MPSNLLQARAMIGKTFGRMTVLRIVSAGGAYVLAKRGCGTEKVVKGWDLRSGTVVSCNCKRFEAHSHGHCSIGHSRLTYNSWLAMVKRCTVPTAADYPRYGGSGIKVCKRWLRFEDFLKDMGERPSKEYTIGRKCSRGHYVPTNCKWETFEEQNNNLRSNVNLTFRGKRQSVARWSREVGIADATLRNRLKRGMSVAASLSAPLMRKRRKQ